MSDTTEIAGDYVGVDKFGGDKVGRDKIINLPDPLPKAFINLPAYNHNFTGRVEQLDHIAATFAAGTGAMVVTQAISGLGGVGKTQMALAYAHHHRGSYDVVWVLPADSTAALDAGLRELGAVMELNIANKDVRTARQMVLNALSNGEKQVFLLYDNADTVTPHDLNPYLPSNCHLLISSRRDASQWQGIAKTVTLETFTKAEAMAFWRRRLDGGTEVGLLPKTRLLDDEKARLLEREALAKALGRLPLAMEQAAALMVKRKMSAADYLAVFQKDYDKIKARENIPDRYHATVATTWGMNFEQAKKTEGAADLLNLCSFFAPTDIPLQLMQDNVALLPDELAAVMADEAWGVGDALEALQSYSLLTVTNGTDGDAVAVHRLVQLVARERMGVEQAAVWAGVAVKLLASVYDFDRNDMDTWEPCGQLMPHVAVAVALAADLDMDSTQAAYLNHKGSLYLQTYGDYQEAMLFVERALEINQKIMGNDHPDTAQSLNDRGSLLQAMGRLEEALPFYQQALDIRKKVLGDDHPSTAQSLNNMGGLLDSMGDLQGALPFYQQALDINKKVLRDDHPDTATSLNNMGYLLKAMGDLQGALPFFQQALDINKKVLGDDHPDTATSLNNMGYLLRAMGDYEEARPFYQQALDIRGKALGDNHPDIASSLNNMGALLQAMGDYKEALPFFKQALDIRKKVLGGGHPDTASSLNNMGALLQAMGDYKEALPFFKQSLDINKKVLGDNHPGTARSLNNMGALLQAMGDYEGAQPFYQQALIIDEKVLGKDHPSTAIDYSNMGGLLFQEGKYIASRPYLEKAVRIYVQVHGKKHPDLVKILFNLGVVMLYSKQHTEARRYFNWALSICRETDETYAECAELEQVAAQLPTKIGKGRRTNKRKHNKKKRR